MVSKSKMEADDEKFKEITKRIENSKVKNLTRVVAAGMRGLAFDTGAGRGRYKDHKDVGRIKCESILRTAAINNWPTFWVDGSQV